MCFKTNASNELLLNIVKEWSQRHQDKDFKGEVNFETNDKISKLLKNQIPRFLPNPEVNWGPKSAARIKIEDKVIEEKRKKAKELGRKRKSSKEPKANKSENRED